MALFDFEKKVDELDSLLEGYTDEYLETLLEADSKGGVKAKITALKDKVRKAYYTAIAPKHLKDPNWDIKTTQKQMMDDLEKGDKHYVEWMLRTTQSDSKTAAAEKELMELYMGLFPYNAKKIKAQLNWFDTTFAKAVKKKAKEMDIRLESYMGILEEAAIAVFESSDDIKDAFLLDKDAVVIGAEDDKDVEAFIDKIPEDAEDEDLDDLVEAFVESDDDDDDYECDDDDCDDDDDDEECEESYYII